MDPVRATRVESTLPLNPADEVAVAAYNPLATDERPSDVEPAQDMRTVLNEANSVARARERAEEYTVFRAERRAADVDTLDLTSSYEPPVVIGVPVDTKPPEPSAPPEREEEPSGYQPAGYQIASYDVSNYDVQEYKSIYDS